MFFSNLPPRILSQFNARTARWEAWFFDGFNQVGERAQGASRAEALATLRAR